MIKTKKSLQTLFRAYNHRLLSEPKTSLAYKSGWRYRIEPIPGKAGVGRLRRQLSAGARTLEHAEQQLQQLIRQSRKDR